MHFQNNSTLQQFPFHFQKRRAEEKSEEIFTDSGPLLLDLPAALKSSVKITHNGSSETQNQSNVKAKRPVVVPKHNPTNEPVVKPPTLAPEKNSSSIIKPISNLGQLLRESAPLKKLRTVSVEPKVREGSSVDLIKAYLESGHNKAQNNDFEKALAITSQAKGTIDKQLEKKCKFDFETLFVTYYNLVALNYRLRNIPDCEENIKNAFINCQAFKLHKTPTKVIQTFGSFQDQVDYLDNLAVKDILKKHECKVHLQACILNSELGDHAKAFYHARNASKLACRLLYDSLLVAYHLYHKLKDQTKASEDPEQLKSEVRPGSAKGGRSNPESLSRAIIEKYQDNINETIPVGQQEIDNHKQKDVFNLTKKKSRRSNVEMISYLEKVIPILEGLVEKLKGKRNNIPTSNRTRLMFMLKKLLESYQFESADMRNLYNNLPSDHFLYTYNLMAIIQLQTLNLAEFSKVKSLDEVIEVDALIEQILLITVSLYCTSTELRFWNEERQNLDSPPKKTQIMKEYQTATSMKKESELWIGRCLAYAFVYLPHSSPLAGQIFNIYNNVYDSTKFPIPEEGEVDYQLKYLVPAKGIEKSVNCFIPIVKTGSEDEAAGIEPLIFIEKDHTVSTRKTLDDLKLFDTSDKLYENLVENYSQLRQTDREPFYFQAYKKTTIMKSGRPQSNRQLNRSLNRISSTSPNPNDNSFQRLKRIYLGHSFFKSGENDQSTINESLQKEPSELDLRPITEPDCSTEGGSSSVIKDVTATHIEMKPSLIKIRPKVQLGMEDIRKGLKTIMKSKESIKMSEHPIKVLSSSKMFRPPTHPDSAQQDSAVNMSVVLEKTNGIEEKMDKAVNKSFDSKSSVVKNISNSGNALPKSDDKISLEKLIQKHSLGQLLSNMNEKRVIKPLKSSLDVSLKTFFQKSGLRKDGSHSPEARKTRLNASVEGIRSENQKSRPKIEKAPLHSNKEMIKSIVKSSVRPSSSIKARPKLDENIKQPNVSNSFNFEENKVNLSDFHSAGPPKEALKQNVTISNNTRSSSFGKREAQYKQRMAMFKKVPEIE